MTWNWQQTEWPEFSWDSERLQRAERFFAEGTGLMVGTSRHLGDDDRDTLIVDLMSREALGTSAIEGESLDRESVQSSIRRQLGLATDHRTSGPREAGIAEMMVHLYRHLAEPLERETLLSWHRMVMNQRHGLEEIGGYRTHEEAMQIVSGPDYDRKVHYEAPPSSRVPTEMDRFLDWFERTSSGGKATLPVVTRAGIAHLWFESIHPFEDGNGRIGRAIAEKALAQGGSTPVLTGLATTLMKRRKGYYQALGEASQFLEITDWLLWFASAAIEAQRQSLALVEFLIDKAQLLDRLRGKLNQRQEKVLLRMFQEGPEGFEGGLSAGNYVSITGASPATARRDLASLVEKRALHRTGERKGTRYHLLVPPRSVKTVQISDIE